MNTQTHAALSVPSTSLVVCVPVGLKVQIHIKNNYKFLTGLRFDFVKQLLCAWNSKLMGKLYSEQLQNLVSMTDDLCDRERASEKEVGT